MRLRLASRCLTKDGALASTWSRAAVARAEAELAPPPVVAGAEAGVGREPRAGGLAISRGGFSPGRREGPDGLRNVRLAADAGGPQQSARAAGAAPERLQAQAPSKSTLLS